MLLDPLARWLAENKIFGFGGDVCYSRPDECRKGQQTWKCCPWKLPRDREEPARCPNTTSEHPHIPKDCVGTGERLFLVYFLVPSPKLTPKALPSDEIILFLSKFIRRMNLSPKSKNSAPVSFRIAHRSRECAKDSPIRWTQTSISSLANGDSARLQTACMYLLVVSTEKFSRLKDSRWRGFGSMPSVACRDACLSEKLLKMFRTRIFVFRDFEELF